ncbi:LysM peptidoglycan-binding domain-containing protein [Flavobacterium sp. Arc2]|uniref:LysM peptidoglycan-binding domain-containing protein n=1 Tax=Flavobacterium sp. Arc2 TaxID=3046685 RepID=UPI00352DE353
MMKYFFAIYITVFFFTTNVFSQEKPITHKVEKGETINQIAQKYRVTPFDIYQLNPDAQSGLRPNSVLLIPNKAGAQITSVPTKTIVQGQSHLVIAKETLYGIEKKYGISDEDLKRVNPFLENDGLQIGQTLTIPSKNSPKNSPKNTIVNQDKFIYHDVLAKETKYSISKKYGITIEELEKRNPEVISNLPIGYRLIIKGVAPKVVEKVTEKVESKDEKEKQNLKSALTVIDYVAYEVKPKETLYSLSKMFDMTQEELIALNPDLNNGVEIGMLLRIPSKTPVSIDDKKEYKSLSKKITYDNRKRMVMLLPFNLANIEGDTINSTYSRLKKDKFLNMTLDFYAGALIAIDSAKTLGLPIDVEIYDSRETKNSSDVAALIQSKNLVNANAIIGPFYQSNAEAAAQLVGMNNVPVISPLSKDIGNPFANLYQTIPTNEVIKGAMFDYMRARNGNIIAVVDKKKESIMQYIKQYQKEVLFVAFKENGSLSSESLKSMLVKGRMNYVVMETGNTWMIKTTIAAMLSSMPAYQVQLVILEPNETLDTDEIKFTNLTKLKLMYPSVTSDYVSPEVAIFEKKFRKANNIFPSDYATRGFDMTFDTMIRLVQNKSFEETVNSAATKRGENKFEYYRKEDGGYTNKGVFILYYDTDMTIKEAN